MSTPINRRAKQHLRNRTFAIAMLGVSIASGILSRHFAPHLPLWLRKDPGDIIWGAAVYWLFSAIFIRARFRTVIATSAAYSIAVEFFKLYDPPALARFRNSTGGHLLLGSVFSWRDMACYAVGIAISAAIDIAIVRWRSVSRAQVSR